MSKILLSGYTFSASAKTITFPTSLGFDLSRLLLITNVTDNILLYNFAIPSKGGTVAGSVLTLLYDTTAMSDSDKLQIFYEADEKPTGLPLGNLQTNAVAVGVGTAVDCSGTNFVAMNVRGITSAVLTFQTSLDGTNYDDVYAVTNGTFTMSSTTTANGNYLVMTGGARFVRANITSWSSGSITVTAYAHNGAGFNLGFFFRVNPPSFENITDGLARVQTKYTYNPTGAPLSSGTLYASGSNNFQIKNAPGQLFSVMATQINATVAYFQLFDRATTLVGGETPIKGLSIPIQQYGTLTLEARQFSQLGLPFSTGIWGGFSSTKGTYTAVTGTDCAAHWEYI